MLDDGEEERDEPITLYFWPTPNGYKISIMLEELGIPYEVKFIDLGKGEQFNPEFLAVSPNNKIPGIVDPDGPDGNPIAIFESGAILHYLARKFDAFYPTSERAKAEVDQWLFWQIGGLGPMAGQSNHFRRYAPETISYAIDRYGKEIERLFAVMERRLSGRAYLAGSYSIADIASFPFVRTWEALGVDIAKFPNIKRWLEEIEARPAVKTGLSIKKS